MRRTGCGLLHWQETEYPQRLLEIYDPPPLLYVRGDARSWTATRSPSSARDVRPPTGIK